MLLIPVETPLIKRGDSVIDLLLDSIRKEGERLMDGDVLALADKVVAVSEGRVVKLGGVAPSKRAIGLAHKCGLDPRFVELVLREADEVYGGAERALLTLKGGVMIANAGVDRTNVPRGYVSLWPEDPNEEAEMIRDVIKRKTRANIGVILVDSKVQPLRMGCTGFALGMAGIKPVVDMRGGKDLYGKTLYITRVNVADDLAAAAHLLMGEADEGRPLVIIRGAPVEVTDDYDADEVKISMGECLYLRNLAPRRRP
ncbi:MAG: coenzyme F420-0:L-glutamate ligase [Candidatus Geothermarchaeales archaeon]